jgi:hypothetical protein
MKTIIKKKSPAIGKVKIYLLILSAFFFIKVKAQTNTFPSSGNVGIGTLSPQKKLHVSDGSILIDGMSSSSPEMWGTGWRPALITPLKYAWRTNQISPTTNLYYGFGMSDNGWYWAISPVQDASSSVTIPYPMSLIISSTIKPRLIIDGRMTLSNGVIQRGGTFDVTATSDLGLYSLLNSDPNAQIRIVTDRQPIRFYTDANQSVGGIGNTASVSIESTGYVGIGTITPVEKLDVFGNIRINNRTLFLRGLLVNGAPDNNHGLAYNGLYSATSISIDGPVLFGWKGGALGSTSSNPGPKIALVWDEYGKVGIGTTNMPDNSYRLYVRDGIRTEKIKVDVASSNGWADYVFDTEYKLMSLGELEEFINANKHLPEIPCAEDVVANGVELAEMQATLLKKIEELTLYILAQNKRIDELEKLAKK